MIQPSNFNLQPSFRILILPKLPRLPNCFFEDNHAGLGVRIGLFTTIMLICLALGSLAKIEVALIDIGWNQLMVAFLIVWVPMMVSMVAAELPRGEDWIFFRFALATFCRTGLPLIFLLVIMLRFQDGPSATVGFMAFFYIVGFLSSVGISVSRFSNDTPRVHSGSRGNS